MKVDGHEQHAFQLEHAITLLGDPAVDPDITISLIENYWAAAFHWIAVGCQQKHGSHKENHTQLGKYLRDLAEPTIATHWDNLERTRQGSMYAYQYTLRAFRNPVFCPGRAPSADVFAALACLQQTAKRARTGTARAGTSLLRVSGSRRREV